jgi:CysZ protein
MEAVMFAALSKAIQQCSDPTFRRVLLRALALSVVVFVVMWIVAAVAFAWGGGRLIDWLQPQGFWETALQVVFGAGAVGGILFASFILFPAVMVMVLSFLLEDIAEAVEARHYPKLPPARPQPIGEMLRSGLAFAAVSVAVNLLALPLYLVLLFVPPLNLILFYGVNGYLFGREYFEIVALRRQSPGAAKRLRRRYRGRLFLAGIPITVMMTIPIVNLFAPIVATGFMVHVFEDLKRRSGTLAG